MKIENLNVDEAINNAEKLLKEEKSLSPAIISAFKVILILLKIFTGILCEKEEIGGSHRNN